MKSDRHCIGPMQERQTTTRLLNWVVSLDPTENKRNSPGTCRVAAVHLSRRSKPHHLKPLSQPVLR